MTDKTENKTTDEYLRFKRSVEDALARAVNRSLESFIPFVEQTFRQAVAANLPMAICMEVVYEACVTMATSLLGTVSHGIEATLGLDEKAKQKMSVSLEEVGIMTFLQNFMYVSYRMGAVSETLYKCVTKATDDAALFENCKPKIAQTTFSERN